MSASGINALFNNYNNSGSLLVYYDFGTGSYLGAYPSFGFESIGYSSGQFSGILTSISGVAQSEASQTLAINSQSGVKMFGSVSGLSHSILIDGSEDLFTGQSITVMVDTEKLCSPDFGIGTGPIHHKEVIFSNVSGDMSTALGFEMGINSANLAYFTAYLSGEPYTITYTGESYERNIWFAGYDNKHISISRYEPCLERVATVFRAIPSTINASGPWYLGSGTINPSSGIPTGISGTSSSIELNNFLIFDGSFSPSGQAQIAKALLSDSIYSYDVTQNIISDISGVTETCTDISGLLYNAFIFSGYLYETGYVTGETPEYTLYSGLVANGEGYYVQEGNYFSVQENDSGSTITGITGYEYTYPVYTVVTPIPVFYFSGVSGTISEQCSFEYSTSGNTGLLTGSSFEFSGYNASHLWPTKLSYIGPQYSGDFIEIITGASSYSGTTQVINCIPFKSASNYSGLGSTLFVSNTDLNLDEQTNLFLNGLSQRYGNAVIADLISSGSLIKVASFSEDFSFDSGNLSEAIFALNFTGVDEVRNLWGVMDFNQVGNRGSVSITGLTDYLAAPFTGINPSGSQIFFNGQKIYEGEDYVNVSGQLQPSGNITGLTGVYHSIPQFAASLFYSGNADGNYGISGNNILFQPKSSIVYINGVRICSDQFVEHGEGKDLINSEDLNITGLSLVAYGYGVE